ncbi:MAG: BNR/Asp-box repeat protein [Ignavibacteria bacterium]|nr:BNR/Asp-box repeat protein [Ignavibacteria bacterium]
MTKLILVLFFAIMQIGSAQWIRTNFPNIDDGSVSNVTINNNNYYAITINKYADSTKIFLSIDSANTWKSVEPPDYVANCLVAEGKNVVTGGLNYSGQYRHLYLSSNNGNTWIESSLANYFTYDVPTSILLKGNEIFVGTLNGIYYSDNFGKGTWKQLNKGLNSIHINCFAFSGNNIFAGTGKGIYFSSDNGNNWIDKSNGLPDSNVYSLTVNGSKIFVSTNKGIFISTNNGTNWSAANNGIPSDLTNFWILDLKSSGSNVYASSNRGIFFSSNNGAIWSPFNQGISDTTTVVWSIVIDNGAIYSGAKNGIYKNVFASIGRLNLDKQTYCQGEIIKIPFTVSGSFNSSNYFKAQVSDTTGSFINPILLDSINSTSEGEINCILPENLPLSRKYRFRIISTDPPVTGIQNSADISILPKLTPSILGNSSVCVNNINKYSTFFLPIDYQVSWSVTGGSILGSSTGNTVNVLWGNGSTGTIKCIGTITLTGCKDSVSKTVSINPLPIPKISGNTNPTKGFPITYSTTNTTGNSYHWYVKNSGITITNPNESQITITWKDSVSTELVVIETVDASSCKDSSSMKINVTTTDVEEPEKTSTELVTKGNIPNPFFEQTNIEFEITSPGTVLIIIYDNNGNQIKQLECPDCSAGKHSLIWNGYDSNNNKVQSGAYFYEVRFGSEVQSRKMIVVK